MWALYKKYVFRLRTSPFSYVALGLLVFYASVGFFIGERFFTAAGTAELHRFFSRIQTGFILLIPLLCALFVPYKFESDVPQSSACIVLSRFCAMLTALACGVAFTIFVPLSLLRFADVSFAEVFCGYGGLLLYCICASAFSLYVYAVFNNTGVCFICSALFMLILSTVHLLPSLASFPQYILSLSRFFSFAWHFSSIKKGILDTKDILFYLIFSAIFLCLTWAQLEKKRGWTGYRKKRALLRLLALVLLLFNSQVWHIRVDVSRHSRFSLSTFTKTLLSEAESPITLTYYCTQSLRYLYPSVKDVDEFLLDCSAQGRQVRYQIIDPAKKNMQKQLEGYGIYPQRIESQGGSLSVYSAVVLSYNGKDEVLPFVQGLSTLEYDLALRLQKLLRDTKYTVQILVGNDLKLEQDYGYVLPWFSSQSFSCVQSYLPSERDRKGRELTFTLLPEVPLVVLGTALFEAEDADALRDFILRGGRAVICTNPYTVDIENDWSVVPSDDYVPFMMQTFGLYLKNTLLADSVCIELPLLPASGDENHLEYVPYTLWPLLLPQSNAQDGLPLFWPSSLEIDEEVASDYGFTAQEYLRSNKTSWLYEGDGEGAFVTNPFFVRNEAQSDEKRGEQIVAAMLTRKEANSLSVIVFCDQYALCSSLIAYTSTQDLRDVRSLSFLGDAVLEVSSQSELLALKKKQGSVTALYKMTLAERKNSAPAVFMLTLGLPLLLLIFIFAASAFLRAKNNRSLQDML